MPRTAAKPENHERSFDLEGAEARLDEAIAGLKRQIEALEAAAEDLKLWHRHPPPSPRPRRAVKNA